MAQARVAVDALRHLDPERHVLPLRVALVRVDAVVACLRWHEIRLDPELDHLVKHGYDPAPVWAVSAFFSGGSVAKHQFLSDEWFQVVEKLVEEHGADAPPQANVMVNLVITETPFGDERQMHMGARDGKGEWGVGHTADADVTLTTDYVTAKQVFASGDPNAGMQAFMQGKVRVQGDMAKLMASQQAGGNPALQQAIQDATE
jgi:SCP-2 sterol transfer family